MPKPPVRGTLKTNSDVGDDESGDRFRLANHILYTMDTDNNPVNDSRDFGWVDAPVNYKNYVADWNGDNNITGLDLSQLCSLGPINHETNQSNWPDMVKPWAPNTVSDVDALTSADTDNRVVTLTFNYDLDKNSTATNDDFAIHKKSDHAKVVGAVNSVDHTATKSKELKITLNNDSTWDLLEDNYYVKHTRSEASTIRFDTTNDKIWDFDSGNFSLDASNFEPKATISAAMPAGAIDSGDKFNDDLTITATFNRDVQNVTKNHFEIKDKNDVIVDLTGEQITLTKNSDKIYSITVPVDKFVTQEGIYKIKILKTNPSSETIISKKHTSLTAVDSEEFQLTFDSLPPTFDSVVIDAAGTTVTLTMSENVVLSDTVSNHAADFSIAGQTPINMNQPSDNKLQFTLAANDKIFKDVTSVTIDYTAQGGRTLTDEVGNAMANGTNVTLNGDAVTNESKQAPPANNTTYGDTTTNNLDDLDMHIIYDGDTGLLSVKRWNSLGEKNAQMLFRNESDQTELFELFTYTGSDTAVADTIKTYDAFGRGTLGFTQNNDITKVASGFGGANTLQFGWGPTSGNADRNAITNTNTTFYINENGELPLFIIADTAPNPNDRNLEDMNISGTASDIATKQGNAWKPSKTKLDAVFAVTGFKLFFGGPTPFEISSADGTFDGTKKARIEFKNLAD